MPLLGKRKSSIRSVLTKSDSTSSIGNGSRPLIPLETSSDAIAIGHKISRDTDNSSVCYFSPDTKTILDNFVESHEFDILWDIVFVLETSSTTSEYQNDFLKILRENLRILPSKYRFAIISSLEGKPIIIKKLSDTSSSNKEKFIGLLENEWDSDCSINSSIEMAIDHLKKEKAKECSLIFVIANENSIKKSMYNSSDIGIPIYLVGHSGTIIDVSNNFENRTDIIYSNDFNELKSFIQSKIMLTKINAFDIELTITANTDFSIIYYPSLYRLDKKLSKEMISSTSCKKYMFKFSTLLHFKPLKFIIICDQVHYDPDIPVVGYEYKYAKINQCSKKNVKLQIPSTFVTVTGVKFACHEFEQINLEN